MVVSIDDNLKLITPERPTGSQVPTALLNELWEQLLMASGECWGKVISNSMHPVINIGDQVLVERAIIDDVRFADIIVFKRNGKLTIHRVLGKRNFREERHFLEKGDATHLAGLVPVVQVIGRVRTISKARRTIQTLSGRGRVLQLGLAFSSYASMKFWVGLEFCLTFGRRTTCRPRYAEMYNKLSCLAQRLVLLCL